MDLGKITLTTFIIFLLVEMVWTEYVFFTHNIDFDEKACTRTSLFVNTDITSVIQCMALCAVQESCKALFYTPHAGRCHGCATLQLLEAAPGSQFYEKRKNAGEKVCLDQIYEGLHSTAAYQSTSYTPPMCLQKILSVENGGHLGTWYEAEFCPFGTFAVGFDIKVEADQGPLDDSSANAIQLKCSSEDRKFNGGEILSKEGHNGDWWSTVECGDTSVLKAFRLQVERHYVSQVFFIPTDNTAVSYVQFKCAPLQSTTMTVLPGKGPFGSFGSWSESCGIGHGICGLRVRVAISEEVLFDDTGLNDVIFYCC